MANHAFEARLCHTLVVDTLRDARAEMLSARAVRFLRDHPWHAGKQLRPTLFLLCANNLRIEHVPLPPPDPRDAKMAAAIELLHEASLVHDDVVDQSALRRGAPTVHLRAGAGMALLIGDYLIFRGLKMILDCATSGNDLVIAKQLADTGLAIAHGEAEQLHSFLERESFEKRMSIEDYLGIIAKKTAAFFAGCAQGGAALGGANEVEQTHFREFGMDLGLAFQMMDDLIDVYGDAGAAQKTVQNNFNEGTITLPMIHAFQLFPAHAGWAPLAAGESGEEAVWSDLLELVRLPAVYERSMCTIAATLDRTRTRLARMPRNIYRVGLEDLVDYVASCPWGGHFKQAAPVLTQGDARKVS